MQFIKETTTRGITFEVPVPRDIEPTDQLIIAYTYPFNTQDVENSVVSL